MTALWLTRCGLSRAAGTDRSRLRPQSRRCRRCKIVSDGPSVIVTILETGQPARISCTKDCRAQWQKVAIGGSTGRLRVPIVVDDKVWGAMAAVQMGASVPTTPRNDWRTSRADRQRDLERSGADAERLAEPASLRGSPRSLRADPPAKASSPSWRQRYSGYSTCRTSRSSASTSATSWSSVRRVGTRSSRLAAAGRSTGLASVIKFDPAVPPAWMGTRLGGTVAETAQPAGFSGRGRGVAGDGGFGSRSS